MNELVGFILTGVVYIVLQDRLAILDHLGRFGDVYQRVWRWIREKGLDIVSDENSYEEAWSTHSLIFLCAAAYAYAMATGFVEALTATAFVPVLSIEAWRWITHMFMHVNTPVLFETFSAHLLVNMVYLYVFGDNVEAWLNRIRYERLGLTINLHAVFFIMFGVIAAAAQAKVMGWASPIPMVGASGAVSGMLGMYAVLFPKNHVVFKFGEHTKVSVAAVLFVGLWFASQFVGGDASVAYVAHMAGFLAGVVTALVLRRVVGSGGASSQGL